MTNDRRRAAATSAASTRRLPDQSEITMSASPIAATTALAVRAAGNRISSPEMAPNQFRTRSSGAGASDRRIQSPDEALSSPSAMRAGLAQSGSSARDELAAVDADDVA